MDEKPKNIKKDFGERAVDRRKQLKLSQEEVAELSGVSKQTISRMESGNQEARATLIGDLSEALQVSTEYLIKGKRTEVDLQYLDRKLLELSDEQYRFMEDFIDSFVGLCAKGII